MSAATWSTGGAALDADPQAVLQQVRADQQGDRAARSHGSGSAGSQRDEDDQRGQTTAR